ncbi:glycoside hydrolase family 9 protein [Albibacterium sp.]|uniref:glycoside hydrolase family 9 protein n=1 Tax=Albibacterium sp. TaxID=2952885 RepID=UPI002B522D10|nr:glycoside hydrolase family 9 protein [Albibacterium sp.]HUH18333.1 glycoside hydrolase family 9 protein [Albibacterium sp.]
MKCFTQRVFFIFSFLLINLLVYSQDRNDQISENIRLNQLGFYPNAPKFAVISAPNVSAYSLLTSDRSKTVLTAFKLKQSADTALNGNKTFLADLSFFKTPGDYVIYVDGLGYSYPFSIKDSINNDLAKATIKAFYFQRASTALPEEFAGKWHRAAGHADDKVLIHPSAASTARPAGTIINASRGWYDAGDYNKYIVNSGITTATLLSTYEDFPAYVKELNLSIPESTNKAPDLLDEILWNVRWMLSMQDPADGGVYHKLTNASFDGMVMPEVTQKPRYAVQKGTAATLDFAAVLAQASRIFKEYKNEFPGLADSCYQASLAAWNWAQKNPNVAYNQNEMNTKYEPKVTTGAYGDRNFADEFIWAASELSVTSGDGQYLKALNLFPDNSMPLPTWSNVRVLGYYSLAKNEKLLDSIAPEAFTIVKNRIINMADSYITGINGSAYQTVMGKTSRDFKWGSNSNAANQGIALIQAYRLTGYKEYLRYALANLDYLLGRNATGYSFVTGHGSKTPMFPHHRPSVADGIGDPIPGLLVGGPNPGKQDGVALPSSVPNEAYVDVSESYATNEIAINWNAPIVYLSVALEAMQDEFY